MVDFDGTGYPGTITKVLEDGNLNVFFPDDKETYTIWNQDARELSEEESKTLEEDDDLGDQAYGFNQYAVNWDDEMHHFRVTLKSGGKLVKFHGCWRGARFDHDDEGFAVDIWASYHGKHYAVESIPYRGEDPRENPRSLDADICAAINKFFFTKLHSEADTLEQLRKRAERPLIHVRTLGTLDRMIQKLMEYRQAALYSGGTRTLGIQGDFEDDPVFGIEIDVTTQALVIHESKKKIPSLEMGMLYDGAVTNAHIRRKKDRQQLQTLDIKADDETVLRLCEQLQTADKSAARRIRATLRKLGHRGGARAIRAKLAGKDGKTKSQGRRVRTVKKAKG